jgi:hypothetical protein
LLHTETCINETLFFEKFYSTIQAEDSWAYALKEAKYTKNNYASLLRWNSLPSKPELAQQKLIFGPNEDHQTRRESYEKLRSSSNFKVSVTPHSSLPTFQPRRNLYSSSAQGNSTGGVGVTLKDLRCLLVQRIEKEKKAKKIRFNF